MKTYKVSFWFRDHAEGDDADETVIIKTNDTLRKDIIKSALQKVGTYPRSYQVTVEQIDGVEELYVVQIVNSRDADSDAWYHDRDGEIFAVRRIVNRDKYVTCHLLGNTDTRGHIRSKYCKVLTKFKVEDVD